MNTFKVGSMAFFEGYYDDFKPHDSDMVELVDKLDGEHKSLQIRLRGNCVFQWVRMQKDDLIRLHLQSKCGMLIGKFLVPEFAKEIGVTIKDLVKLKPMLDKLDDKHLYEKVIFDSYVENGDFYLTNEQRDKAYYEYKKYRN